MVVIENVGNLVCPALFDLGEAARVVLASVTEGADKPMKYPNMFRQAGLVLLNKTDLLPYVDFDVRQYCSELRRVAPDAMLLQLSATTGDGMQAWYDWLRQRVLPRPRSAHQYFAYRSNRPSHGGRRTTLHGSLTHEPGQTGASCGQDP